MKLVDDDTRVIELVDSWFNGNLTTVCRKVIASSTKKRSAILAAKICREFYIENKSREADIFIRILGDLEGN